MLKIALVSLLAAVATAAYVESAAAAAVGDISGGFTASVAFKEDFKSKYLDPVTGHWTTDEDPNAVAFSGKRDILKYCRRVYPKLDITNIVEDTHYHKIDSWCKASEPKLCKWTHTVRPYKCIVGDFQSEALLVPSGCRFGHEDGRSECNDFEHWEKVSHDKCEKRNSGMSVRSFALLAPCGLDMYSGVEFVCCPTTGASTTPAPAREPKISVRFGDEAKAEDEEKDDPYYDDDDESEEDDEDESYEDESEEDEAPLGTSQDPYFRTADPDNEHDNFKAAERRLEQQHRQQVAKKTSEWESLSARYVAMKTSDPARAESFKAENTAAFQKTVQALQDEFLDARRQLDEVHQERVQASLNERKRTAIKEYRDALAASIDSADPHRALRTLQAYIRSEEKDRQHSLNRFKHLLKSGDGRAGGYEAELLRRLRDIDLRINGTIAMLHDLPKLEEKVKPIIVEFWVTFRRENSVDVGDASVIGIAGGDLNARLIAAYRRLYAAPPKDAARTVLRVVDPVEERQREVETRFDDIVAHNLAQEAPEDAYVAHAKADATFHQAAYSEEAPLAPEGGRAGLILGLAATVLMVALAVGVLLLRRSHKDYEGVPTGDAAPEEKHVNGMQAAGYENPTYRYFDEKA